ncbi:MAG: adenylate/guanylate cyclase domain-containing protein, partial [Burkholderiaceae bacterium]
LVLPEPVTGTDAIGDARLVALAAQGLLVPAQAFDYVPRDPRLATGQPGGALDGLPWPMAQATGHVANFAAMAAARCVGNVGFLPDVDGQVRRLPLITAWQGRQYPTLSLAALHCTAGADGLAALEGTLHVAADGHWRVPFNREPGSYLAVPAIDLLAGEPGLPALTGRIVLVGSSALGLSDRVATPLSSSTAGVTVHAAALSALLDRLEGRHWRAPPAWLLPGWLIASTLLLWWAIAHGRRLRTTSAALALAALVWAALAVWAVRAGTTQAVTPALWAWACLLLLHLPVEWAAAQARIRARTRLLSRYVARPVLDELLRTEEHDPLAPRHADISVLIADMQDYTRITAYSTLEEAASLTRDFLDCLTRPVLDYRGTLDKYTGDGMVAFWGAPLADPDHAAHALDAALAIHAAVARYNEVRRKRGDLPVRVRIGLASGRALVGDLGTTFRSTYTAVGDVINLASRLQQAARDLEYDIVAARALADLLPQRRFIPAGAVAVRGLAREEIFTPDLG